MSEYKGDVADSICRMVEVFNRTMNNFLAVHPSVIVELGFAYDENGRRNLRVTRITDTLFEDEEGKALVEVRATQHLEAAVNESQSRIVAEIG
jgi:hypothetical protein